MSSPNGIHLTSYLTDLASPSAARDGPLFTCLGQHTTPAEARNRVLDLSHAFSSDLWLLPGDRVCTLAQATPVHLEALLAAVAAGCIAAPLNWRWSVNEAVYGVNHIKASVLCADAACLPLAKQVFQQCRSLRALVILGNTSLDLIAGSNDNDVFQNNNKTILSAEALISEYSKAKLSPTLRGVLQPSDGAAFIIFTSGTTGPPRAAVLSHTALDFQCAAKLRCCGYSASDTYLHCAQLFHVGGLCSALAMLRAGARHVFQPTFKAIQCLEYIEEYMITSFIAVPTMIADLVAAAKPMVSALSDSQPRTFPCVGSVLVGAGGLSPALGHAVVTLFPNAKLYTAYGMTEGCSSITFSTINTSHGDKKSAPVPFGGGAFVGKPPPGIQLAILPSSPTDASAAANTSETSNSTSQIPTPTYYGYGEVLTRGPHVMLRYWNDPGSTISAFLPGGWFRTGDLGYLREEDQALWLVGRAKDTVKTGGENVAAAEVERALLTHPGVSAAAVVGVEDPRLGERVAAAVVLSDRWQWKGPKVQFVGFSGDDLELNSVDNCVIDGTALQRHCRSGGLAGFKLPRMIIAMESLPRNATGKVVKPQLKALLGKLAKEATGPRSRL